ncbi:hypothetical protein GCM10027160_24390 [Streptomyces calidiresistens]|uniref:Uncharacterized protein n=1 Tax=Streptomyces calidiresistens TaxID=1485586 RepID=A0A7W3T5Y0_9ACTN|nr:hypothetical protein [Streptomyces calidiresistens]MBB0231403.1 hypothetical protein [Streptomyces calidiresistens]
MVTTTRTAGNPIAGIIAVIADVAAFIIGLWILMYLLDANRDNTLVAIVRDAANWLAGWSRDMFNVQPEWWRVVLNYGIAALVYLVIGNALARAVRRF